MPGLLICFRHLNRLSAGPARGDWPFRLSEVEAFSGKSAVEMPNSSEIIIPFSLIYAINFYICREPPAVCLCSDFCLNRPKRR